MDDVTANDTHDARPTRSRRRLWIALSGILVLLFGAGLWFWQNPLSSKADTPAPKGKKGGDVQVTSALATQMDVPIRLSVNGTVTALQSVDVHAQISATVKSVHIKEGQYVRKGDLLFTLDMRAETANLNKAIAQLGKDHAALTTAERALSRQQELLEQKFIAQSELEIAQNQVDALRRQCEVDQATIESSRVALTFGEINAPILGRTGSISVYPGSLVQPNGAGLVSITQIDPINVTFNLPEREFPALQEAFHEGDVTVAALVDSNNAAPLKGRLVFVDNTVDAASATLRLKAEFRNPEKRLWPGMSVTVNVAPRILSGAITVPMQAVQIGPEKKFVYVVGEDNIASVAPISVRLIQDGVAVVEGITAGTRVVVEGAQNLRPGSVVVEAVAKADVSDSSKKSGKHNKRSEAL